MKNSGKFQNSMRAVTINSEFSLPGLSYAFNHYNNYYDDCPCSICTKLLCLTTKYHRGKLIDPRLY